MKIGIVGCAGRMGRMLIEAVNETKSCVVSAGSEMEGSSLIGQDLCKVLSCDPCGVCIVGDNKKLFEDSDVVIDFSVPNVSVANAEYAAETGTSLVIGTTGLNDAQKDQIAKSAEKATIVLAPNMSLGVNLLFALTQKVAATLGVDYDIEIVEMHHKHKADAPSGTALGLGLAAAAGRNVELDDVAVKSRDGIIGEREEGTIGFATLRGGDVVGDHTVMFAGEDERIELTHKASSRRVFAKGAVKAALWTEDKANGLYSMADVLDL